MSKNKKERVSSQVMELKELIAGPLLATIDADSLSAQRYLDYLFKITFESYDPVSGKVGALRMLTFNYTGHDINGNRKQSVSIPLLTLVPLPLLQVQEADFDFDIQVLDAFSKQQQSSFSFKDGQASEPDVSKKEDTRLRVTLAPVSGSHGSKSENRQSSLTANMKIHVKMRQSDMPGGLSALLNKAVNNMVTDISQPPEKAIPFQENGEDQGKTEERDNSQIQKEVEKE